MNPSPSPSPLDVIVHTGPADWWVILAGLGPLAVLVAALLAFYINWRTLKQRTLADKNTLDQKRDADAQTLRQKTEADSRAEWWRRAQWALDRALDPDKETKALGISTLEVLARSDLARKEELELFDIAWKSVSPPEENGDSGGEDEGWVGPPTAGGGMAAGILEPNAEALAVANAVWGLAGTVYPEASEGPMMEIADFGTMDSPPDMGDNGITNESDDREGEK